MFERMFEGLVIITLGPALLFLAFCIFMHIVGLFCAPANPALQHKIPKGQPYNLFPKIDKEL